MASCHRDSNFVGGPMRAECSVSDAAELLGPAGASELRSRWRAAIPAIQADVGYDGPDWEEYLASLNRDHGPTAYVFRCRHCGALGGYSDIH